MNSGENRRPRLHSAAGTVDEVEIEVEEIDLYDFALFCAAPRLAHEPRVLFRTELHAHLRELVRHRYAN